MTRLEEIRKRCETATKGPWKIVGDNIFPEGGVAIACNLWWRDHPTKFDVLGRPACQYIDGEFIAASREDIPWLLSRLEKAEKVVEAAKAIMTGYVRPRIVDQGMDTSIRLKRYDNLIAALQAFDEEEAR